MIEVFNNLFVGDISDCSSGVKYKIHACKIPCFQASRAQDYLINETGNDLFLNIIDSDKEQKPEYMDRMIKASFKFIDTHISEKVLIHCNEGKSRSASIAMAYMAARNKIGNKTFATAANAFVKLYDNYWVRNGLELYLRKNWNNILNL